MSEPLAHIVREGSRVAAAAEQAGIPLKLIGGVAVALRCPSASDRSLAREYADVDTVGRARDGGRITELLVSLGYEPDEAFNAVQGATRLLFWDRANDRQLDVFLDRFEMCHRLDLRDRLAVAGSTLPMADVLLMKLQVVETNRKDYLDIMAILHDQELTADDTGINVAHIVALTSHDWGWWRTATMVVERAVDFAATLDGFAGAEHVTGQARRLLAALHDSPKNRSWRLRARIGDRKRWYELPEESH
jgi:hypothetical protein